MYFISRIQGGNKMKSKLFVFGAACALMLAGCGGGNTDSRVKVTGVEISDSTLTLEVGESKQLYATVSPATADNQDVTWSASGDGVVSVDDGYVTALKEGTSTITVKTVDGGYTDTCLVTVEPAEVRVTRVELDKENATISEGGSVTLVATVYPVNASNKNVSWKSDDESVATVDEDGVVTGVKYGVANITATTYEGTFTDSCEITVLPSKPQGATDLAYSTGDSIGEHGSDYCYFNDPEWWTGASATINAAYVSEGTIVFDYSIKPESVPNDSWTVQLLRKNKSLTEGNSYELSFKMFSYKAGSVSVNDVAKVLSVGLNTISVTYAEGAGLSFNIVFPNAVGTNGVYIISDVTWTQKLSAPVGVVLNIVNNEYIISFTPMTGVDGFKAYYVNAAGEDVDNEVVTNGGALQKYKTFEDGKYKVYVTAFKGDEESPRSALAGTIEVGEHVDVVPAGGPKTNMVFGEELQGGSGPFALPDDQFVYWNDQGWCGSSVTVNEAYTEEGTVHATYTVNGEYQAQGNDYEGCYFAFQIMYKNTSLKAGTEYTLTFKVNSVLGGTCKANDTKEVTLVAGQDVNVSVTYTENANKASLKLALPSMLGANNTIVLSNFSWVEVK